MTTIQSTQQASFVRPTVIRQEQSGTRRLVATIVALGCMAVLLIAAWLTPSPSGMGTHQALGLPPCTWVAVAQMPCPTCGMTTAFAHAANGSLLQSFMAHPLGCVMAIATAMTLLMSSYIAVTGSHVARALNRLWGRRSGWYLSAMVIAAWAFKIATFKEWM